jgi:nicotinamidase-related amidase
VKPSYSAFDSTPLDLVLRKLEAKRLAIAGMATEMCVTDTAIAASELGYEVSVVADACASVDSDDERLALAYLARIVGVRLTSFRSPYAPARP